MIDRFFLNVFCSVYYGLNSDYGFISFTQEDSGEFLPSCWCGYAHYVRQEGW